ncbi:MAG: hypothetical protein EOQ56_19170 [Mesorhizobium sp.]|nr:MAG: hypothetical protein EOQ56_19170 [Mesorhizobium sp.]
MAEALPIVVGDPAATKAKPVMLVDTLGNPIGGSGATAQQVQGNVAAATTDSGNPVKVGGVYNLTIPTYTAGQRTDAQADANGRLAVHLGGASASATDAFSNTVVYPTIGASTAAVNGRLLAVALHKSNGATFDRDRKPNATSRIPSAAASTNATSAKASAGDLHCISGYNAAATVRYIKFYAKATAPTVGTDTPVITLALPPTSAFNINMNGHYIATGIGYGLTTGAADADTGALTAADIVGLTVTYA